MTRVTPQTDPVYSMLIDRREKAVLTGVTEVESFDEESVVLHTHGGRLILTGSGLHVSSLQLEDGKMTLEGAIDSAAYDAPAGKRRSLFRKPVR